MGASNTSSEHRRARRESHRPRLVSRLFGESRGVVVGVAFVVIVFALMLLRPVAMSVLSWHRTAALLQERRAEVATLESRHEELVTQVAYYHTKAFISEEARQQGMVLPGERAFVMRELVHPESAATYAIARLRNATVDHPAALAGPAGQPAG